MMARLLSAVLLFLVIGVSLAGIKHYLVRDWYDKGNHFCQYDDGTVLNMGYRICPLSIEEPK